MGAMAMLFRDYCSRGSVAMPIEPASHSRHMRTAGAAQGEALGTMIPESYVEETPVQPSHTTVEQERAR